MNIAQIEENVKKLLLNSVAKSTQQNDFVYELLLAYGHRKQSVTRLRTGERNLATKDGQSNHDEVIWKRHLYYKNIQGADLHTAIDEMRKDRLVSTNKIRFVIVTNFDQLLAVDTKTSDTLDINLDELPKLFDFFLPWAGMEKAVYRGESPADVKAAEKMAKLFDLIKSDNFDDSNRDDTEALHGLNVFLTRLLFCFFAEDTEIFIDNQFSNAIQSHTKNDGSDLSVYLDRLFVVLDTAVGDRGKLPAGPLPQYLADFPYVNGGLFANSIPSPVFSAKSRRMLIECGSELDWSDINPDIFGSMIQAVVHPDQRGGMGMHYTSVTNIMKVIEPLFLNNLYEELEKVEGSSTKLQQLQQRLGEIKIFDPACGSGNFLIIAYKELRKLEMEVLKRLQELELEQTGQISQPFSVLKLSQFCGIELDDFAHEVAILSLWLAEHQMNVEFKNEFGESVPSLPLQNSGNIVCDNACRINWLNVCKLGETYILGNPPYLGSNYQNKSQKEDLCICFENAPGIKNLDYVSCWFIKAKQFIVKRNAKSSFVSTNSISQGEQVAMLWPLILDGNIEIDHAYKSFKWTNHAKNNAGVTCIIVGLRAITPAKKYLFSGAIREEVKNISPYLINGNNTIIYKRRKPISDWLPMLFGSKPVDGGNLILTEEEKDNLLLTNPESKKFIKRLIGADEFIKGYDRWCLWISDSDVNEAMGIGPIYKRINSVKEFRLKSKKAATRKSAEHPHKFGEIRFSESPSIIVPRVSSEKREYVLAGFLDKNSIILDRAQSIPNASLFEFGVISSKMHMVWTNVVTGRLETRLNYSSSLCYNNFPLPKINHNDRQSILDCSLRVIEARESFPQMTLAKLYDPESMPELLINAHRNLDTLIDNLYKKNGFQGDGERLEFIFSLYEKITGGQIA